MLELTSDERPVVLAAGTSLSLERNSPLFDEDVIKGAFSYSFNVPAPPNGPLYGWPERADADLPPGSALPAALRLDGVPLLTGSQSVRTATERQYSVSLSGSLGGVAPALSGRKLHTFAYGGVRRMPPGRGPVPGWVFHANEVVRDAAKYDYVFAPVLAPGILPGADAPADGKFYGPVVLNPWLAVPAGYPGGLPAGGSFAYHTLTNFVDQGGSQGPVNVQPTYGQLASPFPKLRYVLRCVFEESGVPIDEARFLPGELGELVIVSPALAVRTAPDGDGVLQSHFRLADALPDLTVAQLLEALRRGFGVIVDVDEPSGQVFTRQVGDIVAAPAADVPDLTARLAGGLERSVEDPAALRVVYEADPDDLLTKDLLADQPDPAELGPPVATAFDLPGTGPAGQAEQTRLVLDVDYYFRSISYATADPAVDALFWGRVALHKAVDVGGAGGEDYPQGFAYTAQNVVVFRPDPNDPLLYAPASAGQYLEVPTMGRAGYQPENRTPQAPPRPAALRLLFWRGMQPGSDGTLYPLVSPTHVNQQGVEVGQYSTRLTGPAGTYAQLLRGWLEVKRRAVVVKAPLRLSVLDLGRLDLTRKVRLDGTEYLIRQLTVPVPLSKPATAELVRV